ncbi:usg protein [Sandarakinorhabdus oryzae]|jgi:uncharacterized protein Usg|uniref:usg protein n=1 Tax=Sandarakinorhabdus oryzae TaxID=2675220 RepID=UPI0012E319C9|nr:protein usg [Sandarakinorhabdus oryzae]
MTDLERQLQGYSLATVDINYWRPDHPRLLQTFSWQLYDLAPQFPELKRFLDHWKREIEATIHSVRVAHRDMLGPPRWRNVDEVLSLH